MELVLSFSSLFLVSLQSNYIISTVVCNPDNSPHPHPNPVILYSPIMLNLLHCVLIIPKKLGTLLVMVCFTLLYSPPPAARGEGDTLRSISTQPPGLFHHPIVTSWVSWWVQFSPACPGRRLSLYSLPRCCTLQTFQ